MKYGDHGEQVYAMQVALQSLGYHLPRWGADRHWGAETDAALRGFADDHGIPYKDAPQKVADVLMATARPLPACIVDMRERSKARITGRRPWRAVTGITLHQTATCFLHEAVAGNTKSVERARARVANINAHFTVLRNGDAVWAVDLDKNTPHAQRVFNASDVGIEVDGHYPGVEGDLSTYWRPASSPERMPLELLEAQVVATLEVIDFIVAEVARHGGRVLNVHAHRQTAASRISDPGSAIWQRIAIPAMERYGLGYGGPGFFVPLPADAVESGVWSTDGPGRPIPVEWDPTATHGYRDRPATAERRER